MRLVSGILLNRSRKRFLRRRQIIPICGAIRATTRLQSFRSQRRLTPSRPKIGKFIQAVLHRFRRNEEPFLRAHPMRRPHLRCNEAWLSQPKVLLPVAVFIADQSTVFMDRTWNFHSALTNLASAFGLPGNSISRHWLPLNFCLAQTRRFTGRAAGHGPGRRCGGSGSVPESCPLAFKNLRPSARCTAACTSMPGQPVSRMHFVQKSGRLGFQTSTSLVSVLGFLGFEMD